MVGSNRDMEKEPYGDEQIDDKQKKYDARTKDQQD